MEDTCPTLHARPIHPGSARKATSAWREPGLRRAATCGWPAPLQRRLERQLRRPGLAAGIAVAAVTLALVVPAILVTATIGRQAIQGAKVLRSEYEQGRWRAVAERHPTIARVVTTLEAQVRSATAAMREAFSTRAAQILTG